ncbi:MAG: TolC family outer membrane protein [Janthinobacterium lividum]
MSRVTMFAAGLMAVCGAGAGTAGAETLQDALSLAYRTNPSLSGQRALQRATDENSVQARTGWRPVVTAHVDGGYSQGPFSYDYSAGTIQSNSAEAVVAVTQPLYTGGRVANAVRAADARVQAGQQGLRLVEAQTFQTVILAYMDVLRDQDIVMVRNADLATLERQVTETTSRFNLGAQVTRTDVAQAEAQRQQAVASLAGADAQLDASRADYRAAVGVLPGALVQPTALPGLPAALDDALARADSTSPALQQSRLAAKASQADVAAARSAYMPSIGAAGSFGYIGAAAPFRSHEFDREVTGLVTLTQPLVTGGLVASQVRQAKDRNEADRQAVDTAARQAEQTVLTAWSQVHAGMISIHANQGQVDAAATALKGYQLEYGYGLRSTLDVLIADENLRAAQVSLAESRHDTIVAEASLLAVTGGLDARLLLPGETIQDPQTAFDKVRHAGAVPWEGVVATLDKAGSR